MVLWLGGVVVPECYGDLRLQAISFIVLGNAGMESSPGRSRVSRGDFHLCFERVVRLTSSFMWWLPGESYDTMFGFCKS